MTNPINITSPTTFEINGADFMDFLSTVETPCAIEVYPVRGDWNTYFVSPARGALRTTSQLDQLRTFVALADALIEAGCAQEVVNLRYVKKNGESWTPDLHLRLDLDKQPTMEASEEAPVEAPAEEAGDDATI